MLVQKKGEKLHISGVCFSPQHTFSCGQAFRWNPTIGKERNGGEKEQTFVGVAKGRVLHVKSQGEDLLLWPATPQEFEQIWRSYLDLDRDYTRVAEIMRGDAPFERALRFSKGLNILRQDAWEVVISFILSANNNISRIQGLVERLCQNFGTPLEEGYFAFPTPQALAEADEAQLRALGLGYRAPYVLKTARMVAEGFDLTLAYHLPIEQARSHLMQLSGVGPKVADCILLFGYARWEAFPVDVWVARVLREHYGAEQQASPAQLRAQAARFGPVAGYVQQVLFYYQRHLGRGGAAL